MSKNHHGGPAPVPPGNRPQGGPGAPPGGIGDGTNPGSGDEGAGFGDQDPQRRSGGYSNAAQHPRQQPGRLNDGDVHSR